MENLHEKGYRIREKRGRRAKLVAGIVAGVLVTGVLVLAGARIDGLERQVAQAQAQAQAQPGPEWYGIKSVTPVRPENGGGWMVRVVPVEGSRVEELKGERNGK
jgi:hypothetical protein